MKNNLETVNSLAKRLGLSRMSIMNYIRLGMPVIREGFYYQIDTDEVKKWLLSKNESKFYDFYKILADKL